MTATDWSRACGSDTGRTHPARITQADMDRAARMVRNSGFKQARIIMDLANRRIEIIFGASGPDVPATNPWDEEWNDNDV